MADSGKSKLGRDYGQIYDRVEEIAVAVRALQTDALAKDKQTQRNTDDLGIVNTASKLSGINLRLDDVMSTLAGATLTLPPYGTLPTDISSTRPVVWPPSASQRQRLTRGPSLEEGVKRRLEELKLRRGSKHPGSSGAPEKWS
ncbi:hypothetical protein DL767_006907 [Monosporascus sp. MG133]|nr:hypothetical protein DL767_006907 [Monosporascus sp. MG133]